VASVRRISCQVGEFKFARQLVQNPLPVIIAVHEPDFLVRENERFRQRTGTSLLPEPKLVSQFFRNVNEDFLVMEDLGSETLAESPHEGGADARARVEART
jgi:hypothetical protein